MDPVDGITHQHDDDDDYKADEDDEDELPPPPLFKHKRLAVGMGLLCLLLVVTDVVVTLAHRGDSGHSSQETSPLVLCDARLASWGTYIADGSINGDSSRQELWAYTVGIENPMYRAGLNVSYQARQTALTQGLDAGVQAAYKAGFVECSGLMAHSVKPLDLPPEPPK